ncbi:DUF2752 domain-containing protein [Mucilaginibacter terrigena]|uniref:DUF2752 domain-containing protein n=1 Tax=Mucilaginibacter terrigena TaxID=2492395 RepID=A0A4Q5LIQ6_9SPHI|nr:DUF2752 domain-containing protein [Mucilaginibacter terrigena]RYU86148.1 DUF2752 domain-containing protein [Mucilaginibacter terrigena]
MILFIEFCSRFSFIQWLQNHLIPCPFKQLTGLDCPGCGLQRSVIALLHGDIYQSFKYHPATILLIFCVAASISGKNISVKNTDVKRYAFLATITLFTCNYLIKIAMLIINY